MQKARAEGQTSMFGCEVADMQAPLLSDPPLPDVPEWSQGELLKYERELTGFYISAHPLARYEHAIRLLPPSPPKHWRRSGRARGEIVRHHYGRQIDAHQKRRPDGLPDPGGFTWHGGSDSLP